MNQTELALPAGVVNREELVFSTCPQCLQHRRDRTIQRFTVATNHPDPLIQEPDKSIEFQTDREISEIWIVAEVLGGSCANEHDVLVFHAILDLVYFASDLSHRDRLAGPHHCAEIQQH